MRDPCRASPPRVRPVLHDQGSRARRRAGPGRLPVPHRAARRNGPGGEPRRRSGHDGGIRAASRVMSGETRLADNDQAMRILVVDDEETFRFLIGNRLEGSGHLVEDRKSTRLNSSHEWTSYAVVCLKQKSMAASRVETCTVMSLAGHFGRVPDERVEGRVEGRLLRITAASTSGASSRAARWSETGA